MVSVYQRRECSGSDQGPFTIAQGAAWTGLGRHSVHDGVLYSVNAANGDYRENDEISISHFESIGVKQC